MATDPQYKTLDAVLDEAICWREGLRRIGFADGLVSLLVGHLDDGSLTVAVQLKGSSGSPLYATKTVSFPCGMLTPGVFDLLAVTRAWEAHKTTWEKAPPEWRAGIWEKSLAGDPSSGWILKIVAAGIPILKR